MTDKKLKMLEERNGVTLCSVVKSGNETHGFDDFTVQDTDNGIPVEFSTSTGPAALGRAQAFFKGYCDAKEIYQLEELNV